MYCMLTLRLPEELEERLNHLAKRTRRAKSHYVREALWAYIEDLEDIYLAESALEDLRAGRSQTHSLDEVLSELDLDA